MAKDSSNENINGLYEAYKNVDFNYKKCKKLVKKLNLQANEYLNDECYAYAQRYFEKASILEININLYDITSYIKDGNFDEVEKLYNRTKEIADELTLSLLEDIQQEELFREILGE